VTEYELLVAELRKLLEDVHPRLLPDPRRGSCLDSTTDRKHAGES
jgi:hypothetical protein